MLVQREEDEQQALGHTHAVTNDVHRNPVVFVQTEQRCVTNILDCLSRASINERLFVHRSVQKIIGVLIVYA